MFKVKYLLLEVLQKNNKTCYKKKRPKELSSSKEIKFCRSNLFLIQWLIDSITNLPSEIPLMERTNNAIKLDTTTTAKKIKEILKILCFLESCKNNSNLFLLIMIIIHLQI